ncbi:MAG: class I adenylate-forming enzyme family protein [Hyphomicrobiaceae bacterium]
MKSATKPEFRQTVQATATPRTDLPVGFKGTPCPPAFNLAAYAIGIAARAAPDKAALLVVSDPSGAPDEVWSYRKLENHCLKAAGLLARLGLAPGDRIVIQLPNTSTYALLFFGAIAGGFVPIPASEQLTDPEVRYLVEDSGAKVLVSAHRSALFGLDGVGHVDPDEVAAALNKAAPLPYRATRADEPAYLIYTSGTTSKPKGVLHAHRAGWGRRPMYRGWYGITSDDIVAHAGAFNWTYTLGTGLIDPWANAATSVVFTGTKTPDAWPRFLATQSASMFAAVPGLYRQILKYAERDLAAVDTLRHGLMAGESPPPDLIPHWSAVMRRPLYEALGMSEMSTYISTGPQTPSRPGYAGRPQPGRCVAILPIDGDGCEATTPLPPGVEGLLAVHRTDPGLMLGYWNRPQEEAEVLRGEWFIGGDLAMMNDEGYVAHRGRANDIMKALGYRVSPQEVEAALADHPSIAEIACAEVAVRADVSVIGAFIVPKDPTRPLDTAALDAFAETVLAGYKRPRLWTTIEALPRTANGKIKRAALSAFAKPDGQAL